MRKKYRCPNCGNEQVTEPYCEVCKDYVVFVSLVQEATKKELLDLDRDQQVFILKNYGGIDFDVPKSEKERVARILEFQKEEDC